MPEKKFITERSIKVQNKIAIGDIDSNKPYVRAFQWIFTITLPCFFALVV